jgi:hypothetical protein
MAAFPEFPEIVWRSIKRVRYINHMPTTTDTNTTTEIIEVWLTADGLKKIICRVVDENEHTGEYDVDSLSMRGAQREMTGFFISRDWEPIGRWEIEATDETNYTNENGECSRKFRRTVKREQAE